jgi:ABC-type transport system involved in cytochrome bd biosynthesis fused ATPase/permease subunit
MLCYVQQLRRDLEQYHPTAQVTSDFKLELPQVAVVGSQSSGKSSVLESLVRMWLSCQNTALSSACSCSLPRKTTRLPTAGWA